MTTVSLAPIPENPGHAARSTHPASVGQASLWFLRQVMPYKSPYNTAVRFRLTGELDADAVVASIREIARRHESCRTTFGTVDGTVVQIIHAEMPADVSIVDVAAAPDPEAEAQRLERAASSDPFDLDRGPLVRVRLLRIGPREHSLLVVMDHIVADGMSLGVIWRELEALYPALRAGAASPLPPPRKQYLECVEAQNQWLQTPAFARQLEYWKQHLTGAAPCDLPTDRSRPPIKSYRGNMINTRIPRALLERVEKLAAAENVSVFGVVLAALEVLLARYSGQSDISVLIPVACRNRFGAEEVIGYFANVLVLRNAVPDQSTFRELLKVVRAEVMAGLLRQDVPFERVIEKIRPERSLSHDPLASVGLSFLPARGSRLELPGVEATYLEVSNGGSKFDLHFFAAEVGDDLSFTAEYNSDLFDPSTIERLLEHYLVVLEGAVAEPSSTIAALPIVTPAERARLLDEYNATAADYPRGTIPDLVLATAQRTPDVAAASFEGIQFTYSQLDRRSNQVARCLQSRGVGPGALVGIAVERSLEMLIGLLGILKSGAAYVPLDPAYPRDRLAFMAEDSGLRVLVTQQRLADLVPSQSTLRMDADSAEIDAQSDSPIGLSLDPESIAYVIYTSGSTGKPKGVQIPHRAVVNFLATMAERPGLSSSDRLLAVTSLSFDIAGLELWLPLTVGAHVEIASRDVASDGTALRDRVNSGRITVLQATPSTFRLMIEAGWTGTPNLKVLIGGEATPRELADQLIDRAQSVWNMYGPTETTIWSCVHQLQKGQPVLIGRPIANTQIYVLDRNLHPVPTRVTGDLFIGGDGVAVGYLNRPELTADRFINNPFGEGRIYRTGDLARLMPDGALEYLGRNDFQVKLRGYRIELGEIETRIASHPAIKEAVVIAYEEAPGDQRLVAYFTARAEPPSLDELRVHLRAALPEYMVPARFIVLERLPLTANNKVDRKALPKPDRATPASAGAEEIPRDDVEAQVATIFQRVLGVDRVGLTAGFFALGGHSLLAVRLVAEIERVFGRSIPLVSLFKSGSVEHIAALLRSGGSAVASVEQPGTKPVAELSRERASRPNPWRVPASVGQASLWFLRQVMSCKTTYNIAVEHRLSGELDEAALLAALREIVRRHESLRTTFALVDGAVVQVIAEDPPSDVALVDLSAHAEPAAEARRIADELGRTTLDLERGPLFAARLLRIAPQEHALCVVVDHSVADGVSLGVMWRELEVLYRAFHAGQPSPLPPPGKHFADCAHAQNAAIRTPPFVDELNAVVRQLAGASPCDLPTDRTRPPVKSYRGGVARVRVPAELAARLRAMAARAEVSLFSSLLASLHVLLARYSGQTDIAVLFSIARQHQLGADDVIGYFANMVALRQEVSDRAPFRDLVRRVGAEVLSTLLRPDIPYEKVIEKLRPERSLGLDPISSVALSFVPARGSALDLPGVRAEFRELPNGGSKFDFHLFITEVGDGLSCLVEYNSDIFEQATVDRMLAHYVALLGAVSVAPDTRVAELALLDDAERHRLLDEYNATAADYPRTALPDLIASTAERTPDIAAASFEGTRITYSELDRRSNQVARCLQSRGAGPGDLVGILVERSLEMLIGLLGILKSGAAYVPLDPAYPRDRLAFMAEDSGLRVLVTQQRLADLVPSESTLRMDADSAEIDAQSDSPTGLSLAPESIAYVIYTSGSTGKPKGVQIPHRAVVNFLATMADRPGLSSSDRLLAVTSLSFDIAGLELWLPLTVGAHVEIASRDVASDGTALRDLINSGRITVMQATPSTFRLMIEAGWKGTPNLKVLIGGEATPRELADQLIDRARSVWNMYGPTETTIWSCVHQLTKGQPVLIGRPIANTQIYVLDRNLHPVPTRVTGDLFIGGDGVAVGYLNRPELTADRFINNPFGEGRIYRTGDLARLMPDGALEYLGRNDFQVKLRGYRIELGEIETRIASHPAIKEAVVIAYEEAPGDQRLVAYFTARAEPPSLDELRVHLRAALPEYMVPARFIVLERLPLTANNKVDRKALPKPEKQSTPSAHTDAAPREAVEFKLRAIWEEVLDVRGMSVRDSFFDLGGHSLLALKLFERIGAAFSVKLPLTALFEAPTIEKLAELLRREGWQPSWSTLVPIRTTGTRPALFCVHAAGGNVLNYRLLSQYLGDDQPFYGLQARGLGGTDPPHSTVEEMASAYIEEIKSVQSSGPYYLGGSSSGGIIAFEMAQQLHARGDEVATLVLLDTQAFEIPNERILQSRSLSPLHRRAMMMDLHYGQLLLRTPRSGVDYLFGRVQARMDGVANPIQKTMKQATSVLREVFAANIRAMAAYLPRRYPGAAVMLLSSDVPDRTAFDTRLTWADYVEGGLAVHFIPGDHDNMLDEPQVKGVAGVLRRCIDRAIAARPRPAAKPDDERAAIIDSIPGGPGGPRPA